MQPARYLRIYFIQVDGSSRVSHGYLASANGQCVISYLFSLIFSKFSWDLTTVYCSLPKHWRSRRRRLAQKSERICIGWESDVRPVDLDAKPSQRYDKYYEYLFRWLLRSPIRSSHRIRLLRPQRRTS
nr:uncharacterized protein LOC108075276 isoform X3 [Drosophila kikkawai]